MIDIGFKYVDKLILDYVTSFGSIDRSLEFR